MTAKVYRDNTSGFYRAVCKDESCRQANAQRNYWRTGHLTEVAAHRHAAGHNQLQHGGKP